MKLRMRSNPAREFDIERDIGEMMLLLENTPFEKIPPPPPPAPRAPNTTWGVGRALFTGAPQFTYRCATCGQSGAFSSGRKDACEDFRFPHCGTVERPPKELVKEFRRMFTPQPEQKSTQEQMVEQLQRQHGTTL